MAWAGGGKGRQRQHVDWKTPMMQLPALAEDSALNTTPEASCPKHASVIPHGTAT
jgi:hypothetical protein